MTPNELLLWLSARKEGTWQQFRGAVETLDLASRSEEDVVSLPLHQRLRFNFERLGHVEFDAAECENGWRVVPPTLAVVPENDKVLGVLCGARTTDLIQRIERAASGLSLEREPSINCPDILTLRAPNIQTLTELAQQQGLLCQLDAPTALLSFIPHIRSLENWNRTQLPTTGKQWSVRQFYIERKLMGWRGITLEEANKPVSQGLFCFTRFQKPQYFLRENRETIKLPGAIGKYYLLFRKKRRVLRYIRGERSLTLPAFFRPPLLTERALVLCSGFPPTFSVVYKRAVLTYRNIPEEVAGMTAEVLGQDLL